MFETCKDLVAHVFVNWYPATKGMPPRVEVHAGFQLHPSYRDSKNVHTCDVIEGDSDDWPSVSGFNVKAAIENAIRNTVAELLPRISELTTEGGGTCPNKK